MLPGQKPSETFLILNQPLPSFLYRVVVIVSAYTGALSGQKMYDLPVSLGPMKTVRVLSRLPL